MSGLRRLAGLVVAGGLAAGLVAGCGIPDHTDVKVDRGGPVSGSDQQDDIERPPPDRLATTDVKTFVANFLTAAAGELVPGGKTDQRLHDYVSGDVPPLQNLNLVEVQDIVVKPNNEDVELTVQHLGVLDSKGRVKEPEETKTSYPLKVKVQSDGGLRLTKVPPETLLDVQALTGYYTERTLYFWSANHDALVPDLRWLPAEVPTSRVPTELLKMLQDGPSDWLDDTALTLPPNSKLLTNAPIDNDMLTMNWGPAIGNDMQDYLAQQVAWTMRASGLSPRWLQIKINGQAGPKQDVNALLERTPYPIGAEQHAFAIVDGKVRALTDPAGVPAPVPLAADANQNLQFAGFNRRDDGVDAAVVTTAKGKNELRVGSAPGAGPVTELRPVAGVTPWKAPVWLRPRSQTGLVVGTDKRLYAFGTDRVARKLAPEGLRDITAVAVAPDGQRIAVIADDGVWVVPVWIGPEGLKLYEPRPVTMPLRDVTAIAWSGENALSLGGTDEHDRLSITDVTVDSARRTPRIYDARGQILAIAAFPENPALGRNSSTILYQAGNSTWLALGTSTELGRSAVDGPAPTGSPGTEEQTKPIAAFFVN